MDDVVTEPDFSWVPPPAPRDRAVVQIQIAIRGMAVCEGVRRGRRAESHVRVRAGCVRYKPDAKARKPDQQHSTARRTVVARWCRCPIGTLAQRDSAASQRTWQRIMAPAEQQILLRVASNSCPIDRLRFLAHRPAPRGHRPVMQQRNGQNWGHSPTTGGLQKHLCKLWHHGLTSVL